MQIRGRPIGPQHPPYVIAEVSCNHAGSEAVAMALIDVAKQSGADAVKFQFYTPQGMTDGFISAPIISGGPWSGKSMYDLYADSYMPWEWGPRLKARCHDLDLAFIASAYDVDGLNWLMKECVPDALKVASFEATDTPFVEAMAATKLPLIVSLGMTSGDVGDIHKAVRRVGNDARTVWLHCVSAYPTRPADANLPLLGEDYTCACCGHAGEYGRCLACDYNSAFDHIGFSDHTIGHAVACAAVSKGACVLEKHIQLSPFLKTADSHFSATPEEFSLYCKNVREAWEACQPVIGDPEKDSRQFRRAPGGKRGSYAS